MDDISKFFKDLPLDDILSTAEAVSLVVPIPGSTIIIKTLRILMAAQPAATKIAGMVDNKSLSDADKKRAIFDRMWKIAMEDDIITDEEKNFLRPYAKDAGISDAEFELMVMNKVNIK